MKDAEALRFSTERLDHILFDVHFLDDQIGWIVGGKGTILHTTDGGKTWTLQNSGVTSHLFSVHFADSRRGWAVGTRRTILATSDGGSNWVQQSSSAAGDLQRVRFIGQNRGWAVGGEGTIIATSDGGHNWVLQHSGDKWGRLFDVEFCDVTHGWCCGEGGIMTTSNGGDTWTTQLALPNAFLVGIAFPNASLGFCAGYLGRILRTEDGGMNWKKIIIGIPGGTAFRDVYFFDSQSGWAVGDNVIMATVDGGRSWKRQSLPIQVLLTRSCFTSGESGWAVGTGRTVLKTSDGGANWVPQYVKWLIRQISG